MSDFERAIGIYLLPYGSKHPTDYHRMTLLLDPQIHTAQHVKDQLGVKGLVLHGANIVPAEVPLRAWYTHHYPIIIVASSEFYIETEEWQQNENPLARLLNAGCPIHLAIMAAGRCYWQEGFQAFFDAASVIRQLIDASYDYQRRIEATCCNASRWLNPVIVFNEYSGEPMLPPVLRGDLTRGRIYGEWIDGFRVNMSDNERRLIKQEAEVVKTKVDVLKRCGEAVVRVFGYHKVSGDEQLHVKAFTAFFVAPGLLMATRTATYDDVNQTFAHAFKFTTRLRAVHGMLTEGLDLHECRPLEGLTEMLIARVRHVGLSLDDAQTPAGLVATPWNDFLLLEVRSPALHSTVYLLPELEFKDQSSNSSNSQSTNSPVKNQQSNDTKEKSSETKSLPESDEQADSECGDNSKSNTSSIMDTSESQQDNNKRGASKPQPQHGPLKPGDQVFAIGFGERPSPEWMEVVLGSRGYADEEITEDVLRRQWWGFECKCASLGQIMPLENCHNASLLPGTRGSPLLRTMSSESDDEEILTYCGINCGQSVELMNQKRDSIIEMTASEVARKDSLKYIVMNQYIPVHHLCLVFIYQAVIAPRITSRPHMMYLRKFLAPYDIFVSQKILSACHQKMLKDAEDQNAYGMDFYEHGDLRNALMCFREGAKMFSTASIPDLTVHHLELKDALQTNVSAVVVAQMKRKKT